MCLTTKAMNPDMRTGCSEPNHDRYAAMEHMGETSTRGHMSLRVGQLITPMLDQTRASTSRQKLDQDNASNSIRRLTFMVN